jgi:hypothetical protein
MSNLPGAQNNLSVLAHGASTDFIVKLKQDLIEAIDRSDMDGAKIIFESIAAHEASLKEYAAKAKENTVNHAEGTAGIFDMEKFTKEMNAFMSETYLIWYGRKDEEKANISMQVMSLTEMDYEKLKVANPSLFGQYTMNPETSGINFNEKISKVKIADMKEFVGKSRFEVAKAVVAEYNGQYHIPGLEYEKYLLDNPDKVPAELRDGEWYYFFGSTIRARFGGSDLPYVSFDDGKLNRHARWLDGKWNFNDHVILLEK